MAFSLIAQAVPSRHRFATTFPTLREWTTFILQACLVVAVELSDDITRGFFAPRPIAPTQTHAVQVIAFEQRLGLWIEPGLQRFFEHTHHLLGLAIQWGQIVPLANTWYGVGHGLVTALVAAWIFWRRRPLFPVLRNVFLITTGLSVMLYNLYPVAPPRLATGLRYHGQPFHFVDTIFVDGGVKLSFDQYAAMPSLHVAWALIAGITVAWLARPAAVRLLGLIYPFLMGITVIVTGNHYVVDCLGAAAIVAVSYGLALALARRQHSPDAGTRAARPTSSPLEVPPWQR